MKCTRRHFMLPIFLIETLGYSIEGHKSRMPLYTQSISVVDGDALIHASGKRTDWAARMPRTILLSRIKESLEASVASNTNETNTLGVLALPCQSIEGEAWQAMIIQFNANRYVSNIPRGAFERDVKEFSSKFARQWQASTGSECRPINFSYLGEMLADEYPIEPALRRYNTFELAPSTKLPADIQESISAMGNSLPRAGQKEPRSGTWGRVHNARM